MNISLSHAQIDQPVAPIHVVGLEDIQEYLLTNGLRSFFLEDHNSSMISFRLKIDVVPVNEGELAGISAIMGDLLLSGTKGRSKEDIHQTVEALGAQIETNSEGFFASCPTQNAEELLALLAQIVSESTFPLDEFDKAKAQMASSLVGSENDPDVISRRVGDVVRFRKVLPYGVLITENSIQNIQRAHVQAYYKHYFIPENAYLVVVGDLPASEMFDNIQEAFSPWRNDTIRTTDDELIASLTNIEEVKKYPKPPEQNNVVFVDMPSTQECMIDVTYPIFLIPNDPNSLSANIMNSILNKRLSDVFSDNDRREHLNTYSSLRSDKYIGSFSAKVKVQNAIADSAVSAIIYEMERMINEQVDKKELRSSIDQLAGEFTSSLEDPRTATELILDQILFDLEDDHFETYLQRSDTISISTIQEMARMYLKPDHVQIIVVGDKEEVANKLSKFANRNGIEYLDKNGDRYREELQMPPAGKSAQQVINDHYLALGGKSKLLARNTEKIIMTTEIDGSPAELTSYRKAPNKYLMKITVDDAEQLKKIYNGSKGVLIKKGRTTELVDIDLDELSYEAAMNFGMNYAQLSFDLSFVGISNIKGRPANKVRIITESGIPIEEYFDVETKLLLKRIELKYSSDGQKKKVTYFEDYKEIDGLLYPHRVTELFDQKRIYEVKSITLNQELSDDLFLIH